MYLSQQNYIEQEKKFDINTKKVIRDAVHYNGSLFYIVFTFEIVFFTKSNIGSYLAQLLPVFIFIFI